MAQRPSKTLIIAATPRSGSNLFCDVLGSTGVLGKPTEYLNPAVSGAELDIAQRCELALEKGVTPNGVVALKLFPAQFDELRSVTKLSEWFPAPHWLWFTRDDLLAQAISLALARQTGAWTSRETPKAPPVYSRKAIDEAIIEVAGDNRRWDVFFAKTGGNPIRVSYEEFVSDPKGTCERIASRVGIDGPISCRESGFRVQRTDTNQHWRARFIEETGGPDNFDDVLLKYA